MSLINAKAVWKRSFFFNDTATTEIYTLSLHDALPIFGIVAVNAEAAQTVYDAFADAGLNAVLDRKSTRLNSSHLGISYAVFCLKKKKEPSTRARYSNPPLINRKHNAVHEG